MTAEMLRFIVVAARKLVDPDFPTAGDPVTAVIVQTALAEHPEYKDIEDCPVTQALCDFAKNVDMGIPEQFRE